MYKLERILKVTGEVKTKEFETFEEVWKHYSYEKIFGDNEWDINILENDEAMHTSNIEEKAWKLLE